MHGNQSGPLIVEGVFNLDRMIGPPGDGAAVSFYNYQAIVISFR